MARRLFMLVGIVLSLMALSQFLLPRAISDILSAAAASIADAEEVNAEVSEFPAVFMLAGRFERVDIRAKRVRADKIVFDEFDIALRGVRLDMESLVRRRAFALRSADDITARAIVSERELASTINRSVKGAKNAVVTITPEKVRVKSDFSVGGLLNATVSLDGKIISLDDKIVFKTEHFNIDNGRLGGFGGAIFTDLALADLSRLPLDVTVRDIVLEQGSAVIYANNHTDPHLDRR